MEIATPEVLSYPMALISCFFIEVQLPICQSEDVYFDASCATHLRSASCLNQVLMK